MPQQCQSLESSLHQSRGDIRCLVLDIQGPVLRKKLELACEALTKTHPILSTAFAIHESQAYQMALASFRPPFHHRSCSTRRLDDEAKRVIRQAERLALRLARPVTDFTYLEGSAGQKGKLLMRFSTAQMTEGSTMRLVRDFVRLYGDADNVPRRRSFLQLAQDAEICAQRRDSVRHWKRRLEGAKMTQVMASSQLSAPVSDYTAMHEELDMVPPDDVGINLDTVLKTAWALALARLSGSHDVVFGELIEDQGRLSGLLAIAGAASSSPATVGPLENTVPVRVVFPNRQTSALHMMRHVQRECASSLAHAALDGPAIIRECTDWLCCTEFSTIVRYRARRAGDTSAALRLGEAVFTYRVVEGTTRPMSDLAASLTVVGPNRVALAIEFSASRVPGGLASAAMNLFIEAARTLTCRETLRQTTTLLPMTEHDERAASWQIPQESPAAPKLKREPPPTQMLSPQQREALQMLLAKAWSSVLCLPGSSRRQLEAAAAARFYDVAGTLLPAYLLAGSLNVGLAKLPGADGRAAIHVTPAEVISHPTVTALLSLVTRRLLARKTIAPTASASVPDPAPAAKVETENRADEKRGARDEAEPSSLRREAKRGPVLEKVRPSPSWSLWPQN